MKPSSLFQTSTTTKMDISKYLIFLEEAGWSELICTQWKEKVQQELLSQFPDMTEEEWKRICEVVFW